MLGSVAPETGLAKTAQALSSAASHVGYIIGLASSDIQSCLDSGHLSPAKVWAKCGVSIQGVRIDKEAVGQIHSRSFAACLPLRSWLEPEWDSTSIRIYQGRQALDNALLPFPESSSSTFSYLKCATVTPQTTSCDAPEEHNSVQYLATVRLVASLQAWLIKYAVTPRSRYRILATKLEIPERK